MSRARVYVRAGVEVAAVIWWTPSILCALMTYGVGRVAFHALSAWIALLVAVGARDLACRTIEWALRRCERRRRALGRGGAGGVMLRGDISNAGGDMPVFMIDEVDLRSDTERYAMIVHSIFALMLYPEDKTARDTLGNSALQSRIGEMNRELGFRAFRVEIDLNRPDIETRNPMKIVDEAMADVVTGRAEHPDAPRFSGPQIAAEILQTAIDLSRADKSGRGVTLKACLDSISGKLGAMRSVKGANPRDLKDVWHAYRRSAPLTLAFMHLSKVFGEHEFMLEPDNVVALCRLSNAYMHEGENIRHQNAEHPILPRGECWDLLIRPRVVLRGTLSEKIG